MTGGWTIQKIAQLKKDGKIVAYTLPNEVERKTKGWSKGLRYTEDEQTCPECLTKFHVSPSIKERGPNRGKFCSKKCRGAADGKINAVKFKDFREEREKAEKDRKDELGVQIVARAARLSETATPCLNCGVSTQKKFCNQKCYTEYKNKNAKPSFVLKNCINCGIQISVTTGQHNAGYGKYCSFSCASIQRIKNRTAPMCGNALGGKREDLDNKYFRSRWEANYARYLNFMIEQGRVIKWEFEKETFYFKGIKRGCVSYTPDFKVYYPGGRECFVEIKGYLDPKSKTKLARMKKYYPKTEVDLFGVDRYKALHRQFSKIIPHWETDNKKKHTL